MPECKRCYTAIDLGDYCEPCADFVYGVKPVLKVGGPRLSKYQRLKRKKAEKKASPRRRASEK